MSEETKIMKASELFTDPNGVFEARVVSIQARRAYGLYFDLYRTSTNTVMSIVDFTVREIPPYAAQTESLKLSKDAAEVLMNDLWRLGVRPAEDHTPSEINALKRHLEDMRAIAANKLKLTLP